MTITASADGSALGNPGPTGWAWYISDTQWAAGGMDHATNNIGELTAVLELLRATKAGGAASEDLTILCDSKYVINSLTTWMPGWKRKGWKKADGSPVLNVELMKALDAELQHRSVRFTWVKGHAGHPMNEAADARARAAATAFQEGRAVEQGPGFTPDGAHTQAAAPLPLPLPDRGEEQDEPEPLPIPDLFSGVDELAARREQRDRFGFTLDCADIVTPLEAERALWAPDSLRSAGLGRREAVVGHHASLIDARGYDLSPQEWARGIARLANGHAGYPPASVGQMESIPIATDLTLLNVDVNAGGLLYRVTSLWSSANGTLELLLHRVGEIA